MLATYATWDSRLRGNDEVGDSRLRGNDVVRALIAALCWTACLQAPAQAQALADPTRPPPSLMSAPAAAAEASAAPAAPRLQSILIAGHTGGRHVAVIDGQTVRLGQQFRGARVDSMTATEVVLVKGAQKQVLKLFPGATPTVQR